MYTCRNGLELILENVKSPKSWVICMQASKVDIGQGGKK